MSLDGYSLDSRLVPLELRHMNNTSFTSDGKNYAMFSTFGSINTTEANRDCLAEFQGYLRKLHVYVLTNSKNGATVINFRKNGASFAPVSFDVAETGEKVSAVVKVPITYADLIDVEYDCSASNNTGNFNALFVRALCEIVKWNV